MSNFVDYYTILKVSPKATQEEIRQAYKKEALISHPDRLPEDASEEDRREATRQFQLIADAYHTLGDKSRRAAYDRARASHGSTPFATHATPTASSETAHNMFSSAFEELLKDEVEHPTYMWRMLGAGAGLVIGFILANFGGALMVS
ncbi:DnaJ domain-containing protein [Phycomyces blakesleeanus]|uniref:DnaJ domain-containing protein n=1 Tax=Phycomyces blakesleeanus TaxID=4837 RepID=A0ABR3BBM9_PHYBL